MAGAQADADDGAGQPVLATTLAEPITPVVAAHIADGIEQAADEGYGLYLIELDTPGGLDSSMRDIVQSVVAAEVPVVVHVSPAGGRAASAGAVILLSSHVAAMTPGTTTGSATPVSVEGEQIDDKVLEDAAAYVEELALLRDRNAELAVAMVRDGVSVTAGEARDEDFIEVVASSREELLSELDGLTVVLGDGEEVTLQTAGSAADEHDLGFFRQILQWLSDPNIALLLMSIGTLGLVYELASPGIGAGGFIGIACLVTGLFALAVLPVSVVGLLFLLVAAGFFLAEVFAPGVGLFAALGTVSLVLSGIFLLSEEDAAVEVNLLTLVPLAVLMFVAVVAAGRLALRAQSGPSTADQEMAGLEATVRLVEDTPQVFVEGAWWRARAVDGGELEDGAAVQVQRREGLEVLVERRVAARRGAGQMGAEGGNGGDDDR